MTKYDSLIFDLDGTLWNASEASAAGWSGAAKTYGRGNHIVSPGDIRKISGKPFLECARTIFPDIDVDEDKEFLAALQAGEKASIESLGGNVYKGVSNGMAVLAEDYKLFLVSNCQDWYLQCFWSHAPIQSYFTHWDCHGMSNRPKSEMIKALIHRHGLIDPIYIGDTIGDKYASDDAGVDFGHAAYGFGSVTEAALAFQSFGDIVSVFATPSSRISGSWRNQHS